jgi:histone demethylase JARID1
MKRNNSNNNSNHGSEEAIQKSKLLCCTNTSEQDLQEISKLKQVDDNDRKGPPLDQFGVAPVFHPTETEWNNPFTYLHKIYDQAEKFGICKVVPPPGISFPFSIDPDRLTFHPRVQPLCLLEAKQRLWLTFHSKLSQFWSQFKFKINYPIIIRGRQVCMILVHIYILFLLTKMLY